MPEQKVDFRRGLSSTIPSEIVPGTILIETDTGNMYVDDTETSRVQIKDSTKLPLTGGVVSGNLRVNGLLTAGGIVWLLGPNTQIANAEFVTGPTLNNNRIFDVGVPASDTDAANKAYVDSSISSAIGSVTSFAIDSNGGSGYASLQALQSAHPTGEVGVFYLVVSSDSSTANLFDEYFWTGTSYEKAGGFGDVSSGDLATKEELENYLPLDGSSSMTGDLNLGSHKITNLAAPTLSTDAATKQYVDSQISGAGQGDFLSNGSIPMTGNLQMNNHRITGVATPTEDTDAVNKQYVDEHSSSGGADETIYTANGVSIQPSNQPFNIGSSSDTGHMVENLYAQNGFFSVLSADYLLSKDILVDSLSVGLIPFARRSSASNFDLEIGNNDNADHVSILARQGINLILQSNYQLKFMYDETAGCELLPSPDSVINIGSDTFKFASSYINTVYTQKLSPIPSSQSSGLDLSNYTAIDLGDSPFVEISSSTSSGMPSLDIGYSTHKPDKEFEYVSVWGSTAICLYCNINGETSGLIQFGPEDNGTVSFAPVLSATTLGTSTLRFSTVYCESVSESSDADSKSDIHYLDSNNRIATRSVIQDSQITTQDVINFVKNLDPATFIYKREGVSTVEQAMSEDPDIIHLGIIANDIEDDPLFNYVASKVTSKVKDETEGEIEKTVYSIKPASLAVAALTACKYLIQEVESLKSQLN